MTDDAKDPAAAARARRYRERRRRHNLGDHGKCLPERCKALQGDDSDDTSLPVTSDVTRPVTHGRDANLGAHGQELWDSVTAGWQPGPLHAALLREACRVVDRLERLDRQLRGEDWLRFHVSTDDGSEVHVFVDKALSEAREQEGALRQLVIELLKVANQQDSSKKGGGVLDGIADELAAKRRAISAG